MSVQRVVVTRTGGFAGIVRRAEVDDPERAEALSSAVRAVTGREADDRRRDAFVYEFRLVTTTEETRVDLPEGALDPDLRDRVRSLFR
ncbi:protealysin inhibitor emfourin [Amnibacterium endophyticum]|uniref:Protealysin inhibitor emfourin n=1 Tax=Amnibacterium endophyticum TaxID=2109337 RepID=A0ABW4LBP4_9MICO